MYTKIPMSTLSYFFHHVFLPPKLPDGDDRSASEDDRLLGFIEDCLVHCSSMVDGQDRDVFQELLAMVQSMRRARNPQGSLDEKCLYEALHTLSTMGSTTVLPLEITEQNAATIVRKTDDGVVFEVFELSPDNASVLTTPSRLVRHFPSTAIAIASSTIGESGFIQTFANTLARMSHQAVPGMRPQVRKAKQSHDEERDTTKPCVVTEFFASVLLPLGSQIIENTLCKNTREEVMWNSAKLPWRRTPLWLLVRVAIQSTVRRRNSGSDELYKQFMAFLMSRIMDAACSASMASDVLHTMSAKLSRRLLKMKHSRCDQLVQAISQSMVSASRLMQKRWDTIRQQADPPLDLSKLSLLEAERDTLISIPELDKFLHTISLRTNSHAPSSFTPVSQIRALSPCHLPIEILGAGQDEYRSFRLAAFETWVDKCLASWLACNLRVTSTCDALKSLVEQYHADADEHYQNSPESRSRMLLTILELWIAADQSAVIVLPLLKDYEHEIPVELYQSLLLGCFHDMERLDRAEGYLIERTSFADQRNYPSIFTSFGEAGSFSTRYFSQSPKHKKVLLEIEEHANAESLAKSSELKRLQTEYRRLVRLHDETPCQMGVVFNEWGDSSSYHSPSCNSCSYERQAKELKIQVHEWPLPTSTSQKEAVVVELDPPSPLQGWRDLTIYFIGNVLKSAPVARRTPTKFYALRDYGGLSRWKRKLDNSRLHLLSEAKPHLGTHRSDKCLASLGTSDVCVHNGLRLLPYDDHWDIFTSKLQPSREVSSSCLVRLPQRSWDLEKFMVRTHDQPNGEYPNEVLASQHLYPAHMTLGECKALVSLPYGYKLQWISILRELTSPHIDFNKDETVIFLAQICLQTGPALSGQACRASHSILTDDLMVRQLLTALHNGTSRIEENLESTNCLWIFSVIAARCLAITKTLKEPLLEFLDRARTTAYRWLVKLVEKSSSLQIDEQRKQLQHMLLNTALICSDTFNMDQDHIEHVLGQSDAVSILVQSSIIIHDHAQLADKDDSIQTFLFDRWRNIMHRTSPILRDQTLLHRNNGLDSAILQHWPGFISVSDWRISPSAGYWMESPSSSVHYNTLTGELLVKGRPLSRLPASYLNKQYRRLFGRLLLNVMPSSLPAMEFSSTKMFEGHQVHFGMQYTPGHSDQLLIHMMKPGSNHDVVSSAMVAGILPDAYVHNFTHWYNHDTEQVEFRPNDRTWQTSEENWRLVREQNGWKLTRGQSDYIVNPWSIIAGHISKVFGTLEDRLHQHVLYDAAQRRLSVELPRFRMDFSICQGSPRILSSQFRDMQVDERQSINALVGLKSKLVLRGSDNPGNRLVLIPDGQVILEGDFDTPSVGMHTQVHVDIGTASKLQAYWIDERLGRLMDCGTLQSKLLLAQLHATTSYCLSDPMTGKTGTEQALMILKSSAVASSLHLNREEGDRLKQIAGLAPIRQFYPRNEKVMQTVQWSRQLSFISQHSLFYTVAKDLLGSIKQTSFLFPNQPPPTFELDNSEMELVKRDLNGTAYLRTDGFGAEMFSTKTDASYKARDRNIGSQRAERTRQMAIRAYAKSQSLQERPNNNLPMQIYDLLSEASLITARNEEPELLDVQYSADWLTRPESALPDLWYRIHYAFQHRQQWINRFQTVVWLAAQAYASEKLSQVVQTLFAMACLPRVSEAQLPAAKVYNLSEGFGFKSSEIKDLVTRAVLPLRDCPESDFTQSHWESRQEFEARQRREYHGNKAKAVSAFVKDLSKQWPCRHPRTTWTGGYINGPKAMSHVSSVWQTWYDNWLFFEYLLRINDALSTYEMRPLHISPALSPVQTASASRSTRYVAVEALFRCNEPSHIPTPSVQLSVFVESTPRDMNVCGDLNGVLDYLRQQATSEYELDYVRELQQSQSSLRTQEDPRSRVIQPRTVLRNLLQKFQIECKSRVSELFASLILDTDMIRSGSEPIVSQGPPEEIETIPGQANFYPRRSPSFFLGQLQEPRWKLLSESWKKKIVAYGVALADLQRADRLLQHYQNESELIKELRNPGHEDWDPMERPAWLLMECDSGLLMRRVQHQIALQMIDPPNSGNATMQLNMGEGKSSVIAPSIALALADSSRLVRLIVTKPQFQQMLQILLARLGNLVGRRVYQFPISRDVRLDNEKSQILGHMMHQCMERGGIMLVQPEHLLSFQLMGIEQMIGGEATLARVLLKTQAYFDACSRDIIDESDEVLSVKFELVYTIGQQRPTEHSPHRWLILQQILEHVRQLCPSMESEFPQSMEVYDWHQESWRYPRIRIFREDALRALLKRLSETICREGLEGFPIARQPEAMRSAVQRYISMRDVSPVDVETVEKGKFWTDAIIGTLLLLRGLIAGGVIAHALSQKRWRVNYGVHENRVPKTRLAVPFRAKDDPAPRSEFSHPDVVMVLTSFSYYYSGLSDEDLFDSFSLLKNSDQAASEYSVWVHDAPNLPRSYHDLAGINLRDRVQCSAEIFPHLRYSKGAIDYFMSHNIFAKEMKEFPHKLTASGWDLCKVKSHSVTGFSGTNDSRYILPASITQLDLPQQTHTNALVLDYLVRPENKVFLVPKCTKSVGPLSDGAEALQQFIGLTSEVRVILDVGAQIIDLTNKQVAQQWLKMRDDDCDQTQAVIFFDDDDVLSVIDRSDCVEPFQISPFAKQTDKCLVFLDESHTRGTDLKLPKDYRAAVTLGQNITKDRLVQACMRMRMLGNGQSVVFCIPDEIKNRIKQQHSICIDSDITVTHVLTWAIRETHFDAKKLAPLWATQASRFYKQDRVRQERVESQEDYSTTWAEHFLEDEAHSLERRYRPGFSGSNVAELCVSLSDATARQITDHLGKFGPLDTDMASLHEQQERELSPEVEEERQVERPPCAEPLAHRIHPNVRHFVRHGVANTARGGMVPAFQALCDTSAAAYTDINEFPCDLLVTEDFARTVKLGPIDQSDLFQRPVQWILSSGLKCGSTVQLVVISQYEAQELLEDIKRSDVVILHLYNPRMNANNPSLDHFMLYTVPRRQNANSIPRHLANQVNLFAGQLYLPSFEEYSQVCETLCLAYETINSGTSLEADGFVPPGCKAGSCVNDSRFTRSPTKFLHELMTKIRRNNEGIEKTHMGKLLVGKLLKKEEFH